MGGSLEPDRVDQPTLPLHSRAEGDDVYLLRPGQRLVGRYTIERRLGWGRFGQTYLARSDGGKDVAVKVVLNHAEVERRGVEACINLNHPNLVTIYDAYHFDGEGHGLPTAVMEYVEGPSLRDLLRDSPEGLGEAAAMELLRQVAAGVDFLHERGIVHRDLKPGNILCGDGGAKICDYGLAKPMDHLAQTTMVGTLPYRPPDAHVRDGRAIDLYALAVILCEILTGRMPFTGRSDHELLLAQWQGEADLGAVREPFATVIRRSLSKDPADWYGSAREMVEAVEGAAPAAEKGRARWWTGRECAAAVGAAHRNAEKRPMSGVAAGDSGAPGADRLGDGARLVLAALSAAAVAWGAGVLAPVGPMGTPTGWAAMAFVMIVAGMIGLGAGVGYPPAFPKQRGRLAVSWSAAVFAFSAGLVAVMPMAGSRELLSDADSALLTMSSGFAVALAVAIALLAVDWRHRIGPWRERRVVLAHALWSAGVGLVVGLIVAAAISAMSRGAPPPVWGVGVFTAFVLAGMSLAAQVAAPFHPKVERASVGNAFRAAKVEVGSAGHVQEPAAPPQGVSPPPLPPRVDAEPVSSYRALIALLLCLVPLTGVAPICGLHRFYVGKIGTGILWLVTFGLLGVGQLIDGILIVAGHFRDHYGDRLRIWVRRDELGWRADGRARAEAAGAPAALAVDDGAAHRRARRASRRPGRFGGVLCGLAAALLLGLAIFVSLGMSAGGPEVAAEILPGLAAEMEESGLRPELLRRVAAVAVTLLMLWGAVLLMVGRRGAGSAHMLRGLGAVAILWLALAAVGRALEPVSWAGVGSMLRGGEVGPAIEQVTSTAAASWAWAAAGLGLAAVLIFLQPVAEEEQPEDSSWR